MEPDIGKPKAENQGKTEIRKIGPRHTMALNPKGTSAGGGSQGTCKCGYPPGVKGTETHSRKPKAQNQMKPGMRKTGHRNTTSLNPKISSAG